MLTGWNSPPKRAQLLATVTQAAEHAGLVTWADLAHVDARVERGCQIAHEPAKIDALVRGEVEGRMGLVERELDRRRTHVEVILLDEVVKDREGLLVARGNLVAFGEVLLGRDADDGLERLGDLGLVDIDDVMGAQADLVALARFDQDVVTGLDVEARWIEPIVLGCVAKSH